MSAIIRFDQVSKRYKLGLTRTSLPSIFTQWFKHSLKNSEKMSEADHYIWSLRDVSFELHQGQSLALVGPNGAGKSTILKLLAKITMPTSGYIEVNGKLSALIELGAGFHPDLTGRENIYLNGTILGLSKRQVELRFDEIVSFSELDRFIDTPVKRYSSGMAVRLGFAVAACINPEILLVDEVLAVGDAAFRQKCVERIRELLANGTSLIFVSHNLGLVKSICKSAIYLEHGEIQFAGEASSVIEKYNEVLDYQYAKKLNMAAPAFSVDNADIIIKKIEVLNSDGINQQDYFCDKPIEVRVHYLAFRHINKANLVVRIYRSDGLSCCVIRTSQDHFDLSFKPGEGVVSMKLNPVQLFGGLYHAIAWIMDANDTIGITRGASDWFQVRNRIIGLDTQDAVFEPHRTWDHHHG